MYRNTCDKFPILLVILFAGGLLLAASPAQALHECGALHKKHDHDDDWDDDDDRDDDKWKGRGKLKGGCKQVRVTDFLPGDFRIDAPELAARGEYKVGVRTLDVVNPDQLDIVTGFGTGSYPLYDRPLHLRIWYPARLYDRKKELTTYPDVLGSGPGNPDRPLRPFEFAGRAAHGAMPNLDGAPYPLVIVSHGYPGSSVLLTYLTENLASKGFIVVAIDHTDSTHADADEFASTLINRTLDINFVLDKMARKGAGNRGFLSGMVDADRTTVIGYSMGGYGALNAAGAGYSLLSPIWNFSGTTDLIPLLAAGSPDYEALLDPRISALVAFAPWGAQFGAWTPDGLAGIGVPSLFISGAQDQTSGFPSIKWAWQNAVNSDRYLLVYESAIHEVAVNPPPALASKYYREWIHYQEPAWDNERLNNINQHFITAFLGKYILGDFAEFEPFLNLPPISNDTPRDNPTKDGYWKGFPPYSAIGMELHHLPAQ